MSSVIPLDRLKALSSELRPHAPQWADRLAQARSKQDLLKLVCHLFDLAHSVNLKKPALHKGEVLSEKISSYIGKNLHQGLTLKVLANSLGYSEKYCSDLFLRVMGESFSSYVRRRRLEQARLLLTTTRQTLAEISAAVGFSDQFAFSHFFKRATGYSPMRFRVHQSRTVRPSSIGRVHARIV